MKLASFAISAVYRWLTNNSVQKPKRFTAAIVMTHNSHHVAMAVAKYFVLVRIIQCNSHHFINIFFRSVLYPLLIYFAVVVVVIVRFIPSLAYLFCVAFGWSIYILFQSKERLRLSTECLHCNTL